jgi:hypothetical protein
MGDNQLRVLASFKDFKFESHVNNSDLKDYIYITTFDCLSHKQLQNILTHFLHSVVGAF